MRAAAWHTSWKSSADASANYVLKRRLTQVRAPSLNRLPWYAQMRERWHQPACGMLAAWLVAITRVQEQRKRRMRIRTEAWTSW